MTKKVSTFFILSLTIVQVVRYFWFIFKVKIFSFWMLSLKFNDKNDILYNLVYILHFILIRSAQRHRDKSGGRNSREHSSSSLHSLGQRQRDCDNRQTRSSTTSRRTSRSGSRTPRSSRGSRESMGSRGSRGSRSGSSSHRNTNHHKHHINHGSSSKSIDLSDLHPPEHRRSQGQDHEDAEDEGEDSDGHGTFPQSCLATSSSMLVCKPSLPPKPSLVNPPLSFNDGSNNKLSESENSSIAALAAVAVTKDTDNVLGNNPGGSIVGVSTVQVLDNGNHHHGSSHEGSGTVRRRSRNPRSTNSSRPQSTGDYIVC